MRLKLEQHEARATLAYFEVLTWGLLGLHGKPCGFLDVAGYYEPLLGFFDRMVAEGFLESQNRRRVILETDPAALLDAFDRYEPPEMPGRWVEDPRRT